ncbi:hypothetical protein A2U01_0065368, partial [Trifolium medium]|nr:hypothetical protein [Trifolium medium]
MNDMRRVNRGDLYVSFESQPKDFKNHLPRKLHPSLQRESANSKSLVVGAWEHIILYEKFMGFLTNKRKMKDDVFFLT